MFGGSSATASERPTPLKPHLTAERALKARLRRSNRVSAKSPVAIESAAYLKGEMIRDLAKYAAQLNPPRAVAAALVGSKGGKALYMPSLNLCLDVLLQNRSQDGAMRPRSSANGLCRLTVRKDRPQVSSVDSLNKNHQRFRGGS